MTRWRTCRGRPRRRKRTAFRASNANELAYILQRLAADPSELWRLRDGIRSTDWFLAGERALSLEAILKDVHGRRRAGPRWMNMQSYLRFVIRCLQRIADSLAGASHIYLLVPDVISLGTKYQTSYDLGE